MRNDIQRARTSTAALNVSHEDGVCFRGREHGDKTRAGICRSDILNHIHNIRGRSCSLKIMPRPQTGERFEFLPQDEDGTGYTDQDHVQGENDSHPEMHLKISLTQPHPLRTAKEPAKEVH